MTSKNTRGSSDAQLALLSALPHDCLLRVVARGSGPEWGQVLGLDDNDLAQVRTFTDKFLKCVADAAAATSSRDSAKKQLRFVPITKTAGTSIEEA